MSRSPSARPVTLLIASVLWAGVAGANEFNDFLTLRPDEGRALSYAGGTYYNAVPSIWVSSSDGQRYDRVNEDELVFGVSATYSITTSPRFHEQVFDLKFSGAGFSTEKLRLIAGNINYTTKYLAPSLDRSPAETCNEEAAKRGPDAMTTGFVVERANAYRIEGRIAYMDGAYRSAEVEDSIFSPVYLLCAGKGKPTAGGGEAPPAQKPPGVPSDDVSPGFLVTAAEVTIDSKYDGMKTKDCPVQVPIRLSFEGTQANALQYRVTSAKGGVSKTGSVMLEDGKGGRHRATREIRALVPTPGPSGAGSQASGTMVPGKGSDPTPVQGSTTLGATGGGGSPAIDTDQLQQEAAPGVYADSVRIEILAPNKLVSDYAGYRVICQGEGGDAAARVPVAAKPKPVVPPPGRGLAARTAQPPPPGPSLAAQRKGDPTRVAFKAGPMLVYGGSKKFSGQTLEIGSDGRLQKGVGKGRDRCRVSGLAVEWPGDETPTLRLGRKSVRATGVKSGDATALKLPALELPEGSSRLEAKGGATTASWTLLVSSDCGGKPAATGRPADPVRTPGRLPTEAGDLRQRRAE